MTLPPGFLPPSRAEREAAAREGTKPKLRRRNPRSRNLARTRRRPDVIHPADVDRPGNPGAFYPSRYDVILAEVYAYDGDDPEELAAIEGLLRKLNLPSLESVRPPR